MAAVMANAGNFEIHVWVGGYPIWCELIVNKTRVQFNSLELKDLAYAVEAARREAKQIARSMDKDRVEDY